MRNLPLRHSSVASSSELSRRTSQRASHKGSSTISSAKARDSQSVELMVMSLTYVAPNATSTRSMILMPMKGTTTPPKP